MNNKQAGNAFEREFCRDLGQYDGWWVHNMASTASGQPADVIAVKSGKPYLIDCKVCAKNYFNLNRVEENQHLAMRYWRHCGNGEPWFALKLELDDVYMVPYSVIEKYMGKQSRLTCQNIVDEGYYFYPWVGAVNRGQL